MPMMFKIDQGLGTFVSTDINASEKQMEQLRQAVMTVDDDPGSLKKAVKTIKNLISKDSLFLRAYVMLAEMYLDLDDEKQATATYIKGCQAGLKLMPDDFSGPLDMDNPDVICFMHCHTSYASDLVDRGDYKACMEAVLRQLVFDAEDSFDIAYDLGELALMSGDTEEAARILAEQTESRPTAWYSLAYLAFTEGNFPLAASRLRKAFMLAPYAINFMTGSLTPPNIFWEQGPRPPYLPAELTFVESLGNEMWMNNEEAHSFLNWLSQTGQVLTEKAAMVLLSEKSLAAGDVTDEIEKEFQALWNAITEESCRKMVSPVKNPANDEGETDLPWKILASYHEQLAAENDFEDDDDCGCGCGCHEEDDDDDCGCRCH